MACETPADNAEPRLAVAWLICTSLYLLLTIVAVYHLRFGYDWSALWIKHGDTSEYWQLGSWHTDVCQVMVAQAIGALILALSVAYRLARRVDARVLFGGLCVIGISSAITLVLLIGDAMV